jgi:hypothetical protein
MPTALQRGLTQGESAELDSQKKQQLYDNEKYLRQHPGVAQLVQSFVEVQLCFLIIPL